MNMTRWSMLVLAMLMAFPEAKSEEPKTPQIMVYGTATIQAAPNQMKWLLNVRNINPSSEGVAEVHGTTVAKVLAFLKQSQIAEDTIQTSRMQLGENERWNSSTQRNVQDGYVAFTDVRFTLADFNQYSSIWMGLSAIQGVRVGNVTLDSSDRIKFQNEARTNAVLAARDKAKAIAETLGVKIGGPLNIEEELSVSEGYQAQSTVLTNSNIISSTGSSVGIDQVAPGAIPIRARLKATFRLLEK
jgi:uncharacterized protein